jgi:SAM-dependent methyltransferase
VRLSRDTNQSLKRVQDTWSQLGHDDPLWAVLTDKGRHGTWDAEEFLHTGETEITALLGRLDALGFTDLRGAALDFGCGAGRLTQALANHLGRAIGIDVSPPMIERARSLDRTNGACDFRVNSSADLSSVEDASIDLVYSCRVLQHMPIELSHGYITEFFRVARPGGLVVFQIPAKPAVTVKGAAVAVLPTRIANRLRGGMEMHGTPPEGVRGLIADAGGECLAVDADDSAGPGWTSWLYLAWRRGPGTV